MAPVTVVQAGIGGFFLAAGAAKITRVGPDVAIFEGAGLPGWALTAAGLVNVAGGAGMLLGLSRRPALATLAAPASALIAAYLAFAICVALLNEDPRDTAQLAVVLALSVVVAVARGRRGSGPTRAGGSSPVFGERKGGATHLRMQDPPRKMAPPAALLALAAFVSLKGVVGLKGGGGRG